MTQVVWIHRFGEMMASYRYRAAIPSREVARHEGFVTAINDGEADIVILSKPIEEDVAVAEEAKRQGAIVLVDLCDDHFHDGQAAVYQRAVKVADQLVCASEVMQQRLWAETQRHAILIQDPYEMPEAPPHADGQDCIWFGHQRNLKDLTSIYQHLQGRKLRIVTGPKRAPGCIPWSLEALQETLALSHLALLPTRQGAEYKSPNRLLNAIRAGCFPVCMSHPAYQEFRRFVWVGHIPTGLKWVTAFQAELNARVREAQDYIRERYSPQAIGAQWVSLIKSL